MTFEEFMSLYVTEFISTYGMTIIYAILSTAVTALGAWVGGIYKKNVNDETKRKVVSTCCKAVEQLYKDLDGPTKYSKACEAIEEMLAEKNITISALEIEMLIEEVCHDFKQAAVTEIKAEANPETLPEGTVVNG